MRSWDWPAESTYGSRNQPKPYATGLPCCGSWSPESPDHFGSCPSGNLNGVSGARISSTLRSVWWARASSHFARSTRLEYTPPSPSVADVALWSYSMNGNGCGWLLKLELHVAGSNPYARSDTTFFPRTY